MISAYHEDLYPQLGKAAEEIIQKVNRRLARNRFVIHIPGYKHRIHCFLLGYAKDFIKNESLIINKIEIEKGLAKMQIPQMQKFHTDTSKTC